MAPRPAAARGVCDQTPGGRGHHRQCRQHCHARRCRVPRPGRASHRAHRPRRDDDPTARDGHDAIAWHTRYAPTMLWPPAREVFDARVRRDLNALTQLAAPTPARQPAAHDILSQTALQHRAAAYEKILMDAVLAGRAPPPPTKKS